MKNKTKVIEKNEINKKHDFFIEIPTKGANAIRKYLEMGENGYKYVAATAFRDKYRDYYLYGIMDEVEKAGISLIRISEFIIESKKENNPDTSDDPELQRIERNIYDSIIDELSIWIRKLTEILVEVIGFKYSKEDIYFEHYLLVHDLVRNKRYFDDFKNFYAVENENIKYQINQLETRIQAILIKVDSNKCWYAQFSKKNRTVKNSLSGFLDRINLLIPKMTAAQKLTIGGSYQMYSSISGNIHVTLGHRDNNPNMNDVEAHFSQISIISSHIISVCADILNKKPRKGFLAEINKIVKQNKYPEQLHKRITNPNIKVGDFVIAYGDIAEVIKIKKSKFGYKSYRVKYLGKSPLPGIIEDEFSGRYINLFQRKTTVTKQVRDLIKKDAPDIKINNKVLLDSIRKTVTEMWEELGFKERAYGRHDLANKKIEDFLAKRNTRVSS